MQDETDNTIEEENYKNFKLGNHNNKIQSKIFTQKNFRCLKQFFVSFQGLASQAGCNRDFLSTSAF